MRLLVALSLLCVLPAGPVWAHAQLRASEPAAGAVLPASPSVVRLRFSEPVELKFSRLTLYDAEGRVLAELVWAWAQAQDLEAIERGRTLYAKHCASCHGPGGKGDGPLAGSLSVPLQDLTSHLIHHDDAALFQMISRGFAPGMPAFAAEFDMDEILDLIAFLRTLEDSYTASAPASAPPASPAAPSMPMPADEASDMTSCPSQRAGMMNMNGMGMAARQLLDAVRLGRDLDGDGDPDEITVCLQILEISQEIAPGISLPFWVFAPDLGGMNPIARLPGPTLRFEQGDHVRIVVKNTHYFPHTLHMHGVLKPNAMDGVPQVTQAPIQPGESFTYDFVAQNPGTFWYHCHVQPPVHILMGLYGMLIIEPNRPANAFTPLVMTAKMPELSVASRQAGFSAEYALIYGDIDPNLHRPLQGTGVSLAQLEQQMHRAYNSTERIARYFVLNGKSFPYTLLDSPIRVRPDEHVLVRVLNAGPDVISLHLHGHHPEMLALDGEAIPPEQRRALDTITISAGQRVDLVLDTHADGRHASGPGVWLIHDHDERAITTNGINPGGNLNFIVYESFLDDYGLPRVPGDLGRYFEPAFYAGERSVFEGEPFEDSPPPSKGQTQLPLWGWAALAAGVGAILGSAPVWLWALRARKGGRT